MGIPGRTYVIEASSDLTAWTPIATITAGANGHFEFEDPNSGALNRGFYRLAIP